MSKDPRVNFLLAKVRDAHPENYWIVSDLVRPLVTDDYARGDGKERRKGQAEFKNYFGYDINKLLTAAKAATNPGMSRSMIYQMYGFEQSDFLDKFFDAMEILYEEHDLIQGDVIAVHHWGKTPDGRLVILDYGYTHDSKQALFMREQKLNEKIRSKTFRMRDFVNAESQIKYADAHLKKLGCGSSRCTYLLTPKNSFESCSRRHTKRISRRF
jgi:hypothetical protein